MTTRNSIIRNWRSSPAFYIMPKKYRAGPKSIQTPVPFRPPAERNHDWSVIMIFMQLTAQLIHYHVLIGIIICYKPKENIIIPRHSTSLFHQLARLFTSSIQLGYIPTAWKIATLRMLLKPDKLLSLATSYGPISLISSIMKLFERVIEQRLRSHLEQIGFINKHQPGFRRAMSTDDHLFRLSQPIMESFNRGEYVVVAFLDVEKVFDNVWSNGLRYKIFQQS